MMKPIRPARRGKGDETLVTETRQLREELLKNTARLQAFAEQLADTAARLLVEIGGEDANQR